MNLHKATNLLLSSVDSYCILIILLMVTEAMQFPD